MPSQTLTPNVLTAALEGLELQRERVDAQIAEVRRMLRSQPEPATEGAEPAAPRKRRMSAAGRKRIADAARKRWAALRESRTAPEAVKAAPKTAAAKTPKRKVGAAARKRMAESQKRRWAEARKKAEQKPARTKPAAKKAVAKTTELTAAPAASE
jgi:hypothetical protein